MKRSSFFTNDKFPNTHIYFDELGCVLVVSLNITHEMVKYLPSENIFNGNKLIVYSLKKRIVNPNINSMHKVYAELLKQVMTVVASAKSSCLNEKIIIINSRDVIAFP